jgi:hypothetical protein
MAAELHRRIARRGPLVVYARARWRRAAIFSSSLAVAAAVVDGGGVLDTAAVTKAGAQYVGIGR